MLSVQLDTRRRCGGGLDYQSDFLTETLFCAKADDVRRSCWKLRRRTGNKACLRRQALARPLFFASSMLRQSQRQRSHICAYGEGRQTDVGNLLVLGC